MHDVRRGLGYFNNEFCQYHRVASVKYRKIVGFSTNWTPPLAMGKFTQPRLQSLNAMSAFGLTFKVNCMYFKRDTN